MRTTLSAVCFYAALLTTGGCDSIRDGERILRRDLPQDAQPGCFDGTHHPGFVTYIDAPDSADGATKKYGMLNSRGNRLLDPEWEQIAIVSDTCVLAIKKRPWKWFFQRFDLAVVDGAESISATSETPFQSIVPPRSDLPDPYGACAERVDPTHPRAIMVGAAAEGNRYNTRTLYTMDQHGQILAAIERLRKIQLLPGATIVSADSGARLLGLDGVELRAPGLTELSYLAPSGQEGDGWERNGQLFAYALPVKTAAGTPLFWPMDPISGLPRKDATGEITAFEPIGYHPPGWDPLAMGKDWEYCGVPPAQFDFWIVHSTSAAGHRVGFETPGGSVNTGPIYNEIEAVSWHAGLGEDIAVDRLKGYLEDYQSTNLSFPRHCYLARRMDGLWTRVALSQGDRHPPSGSWYRWRIQTSGTATTREAALRIHAECVRTRISEFRATIEAIMDERHKDNEKIRENREREYARLVADAKSTLAGKWQDLLQLQSLQDKVKYWSGMPTTDRQWLDGVLTKANEDERRRQADAPKLYLKALADSSRQQRTWQEELAAREQWSLDHARPISGGISNTADGGASNVPDTYFQESQRRQKYVNELDRYNRGQQNWAPIPPR